jgi:ring-1,2-phenylacetyl-CoA epoxidase subunit PaaC
MRPAWDAILAPILAEAGLDLPETPFPQTGGRTGNHRETLGHLLAEMQSVYRAHPGATW